MKILALDSTAKVASVALCEDELLLGEVTLNNGNTHSETLLPMIESALKISGYKLSDIELFAASSGPGSFTGVRIGVTIAKTYAYLKKIDIISVSSLKTDATFNIDFTLFTIGPTCLTKGIA